MTLTVANLDQIADELARALSFARVQGQSAFVTTAASYPNGTRVLVRVDQDGPDSFFVSDDGHASFEADMMGGSIPFQRLSAKVARECGVEFDQHSFFSIRVRRDQLVAATVGVVSASYRSVERTIYALDERRAQQSREVFQARILEAFGRRAAFDIDVKGRTGRSWEMDAGVRKGAFFSAVFTLVKPGTNGVASAHLKCSDIKTMREAPIVCAALTDYKKTAPELRILLADSVDSVIAANDDVQTYLKAA